MAEQSKGDLAARLSRLRENFNRRAEHYGGLLTNYIGEQELRAIRPFIPNGATVLDYGCGSGRTTLDLLRRGCQVTAYDLSPAMLALAEAQAQRNGFSARFTADEHELQGKRWPYITCIGVLDYYPDPRPLLRRLRAYLQEEGRLVITYPNAASPLAWLYALGSRLTVPATPQRRATARRLAAACGLMVIAEAYAFPATYPLAHTLIQVCTPLKTPVPEGEDAQ